MAYRKLLTITALLVAITGSVLVFCFPALLRSNTNQEVDQRTDYKNTDQKTDQSTDCKISLSGQLKDKLPPETVLEFCGTGHCIMTFKFSQMPIVLPAKTLVNKNWLVTFYPSSQSRNKSEGEKKQLFSIRLFKNYFDQTSSEIVISLSPPTPQITSFLVSENIELHLPVDNYQVYEKLPYWDKKKNKLTSQTQPPKWRLKNGEKKIAEGEMNWLCTYWGIDLPVAKLSSPLTCEVYFDTGNAFGSELPAALTEIYPGMEMKPATEDSERQK